MRDHNYGEYRNFHRNKIKYSQFQGTVRLASYCFICYIYLFFAVHAIFFFLGGGGGGGRGGEGNDHDQLHVYKTCLYMDCPVGYT